MDQVKRRDWFDTGWVLADGYKYRKRTNAFGTIITSITFGSVCASTTSDEDPEEYYKRIMEEYKCNGREPSE